MSPPRPARSRFGDLLLEMRLVEEGALAAALAEQRSTGRRLARILSERRILDEDRLAKAVSARLGLETVDLDNIRIHPRVLARLPAEVAIRHGMLPYAVKRTPQTEVLYLVMSDPLDTAALTEAQRRSSCQIRVMLAPASALDQAIHQQYGRLAQMPGPKPSSRPEGALASAPSPRAEEECGPPSPAARSTEPSSAVDEVGARTLPGAPVPGARPRPSTSDPSSSGLLKDDRRTRQPGVSGGGDGIREPRRMGAGVVRASELGEALIARPAAGWQRPSDSADPWDRYEPTEASEPSQLSWPEGVRPPAPRVAVDRDVTVIDAPIVRLDRGQTRLDGVDAEEPARPIQPASFELELESFEAEQLEGAQIDVAQVEVELEGPFSVRPADALRPLVPSDEGPETDRHHVAAMGLPAFPRVVETSPDHDPSEADHPATQPGSLELEPALGVEVSTELPGPEPRDLRVSGSDPGLERSAAERATSLRGLIERPGSVGSLEDQLEPAPEPLSARSIDELEAPSSSEAQNGEDPRWVVPLEMPIDFDDGSHPFKVPGPHEIRIGLGETRVIPDVGSSSGLFVPPPPESFPSDPLTRIGLASSDIPTNALQVAARSIEYGSYGDDIGEIEEVQLEPLEDDELFIEEMADDPDSLEIPGGAEDVRAALSGAAAPRPPTPKPLLEEVRAPPRSAADSGDRPSELGSRGSPPPPPPSAVVPGDGPIGREVATRLVAELEAGSSLSPADRARLLLALGRALLALGVLPREALIEELER